MSKEKELLGPTDPFIQEMQDFIKEQGSEIKKLNETNIIYRNIVLKMVNYLNLNNAWIQAIANNKPDIADSLTPKIRKIEIEIRAELAARNIK